MNTLFFKLISLALIDEAFCDCQVPCSQTKYTHEVSYSKFPDIGTAQGYVASGDYPNVDYQRYCNVCREYLRRMLCISFRERIFGLMQIPVM